VEAAVRIAIQKFFRELKIVEKKSEAVSLAFQQDFLPKWR
jgi:hypothetical protein